MSSKKFVHSPPEWTRQKGNQIRNLPLDNASKIWHTTLSYSRQSSDLLDAPVCNAVVSRHANVAPQEVNSFPGIKIKGSLCPFVLCFQKEVSTSTTRKKRFRKSEKFARKPLDKPQGMCDTTSTVSKRTKNCEAVGYTGNSEDLRVYSIGRP